MLRVMKEVGVFIPFHDNSGKPFSPEDMHCIVDNVTTRFRGCTLHPSLLGVWINQEGVRYRDAIMVIQVVVKDHPGLLPQLIAIASFICKRLNQEEVLVIIRDVGVVSVR
jgi:hypothetical protein